MNVSKVMARFLPLMDLSILLLGMFLIVLSIAKFTSTTSVSKAEIVDENQEPDNFKVEIIKQTLNTMEFLPVYGCCNSGNGRLEGHCYLLNADLKPGKEIRMDTDEDIKQIIKESGFSEDNMPIICLITKKGVWTASWDSDTIWELEKTWNCGRIYRISNFENLPFEE